MDTDGFTNFWAAYPRKRAKRDAMKAWQKLNPGPELVDQILDAIDDQMRCRQWRDGYIPYPASFIRGERWLDELQPSDFYQAGLSGQRR